MSSAALPSELYESLLLRLVAVLEITRDNESVSNPQAKQKLLQATKDFRNALDQAKELALNIPGGEFTVAEQDNVIRMLETLRDRKRARLAQFAARPVESSHSGLIAKLEIDSMASTPFGGS
ncbi:hypothetical protein FA13DRAFT_1756400 [Coprinellus micaceus]|uniref:Mediator of RNA polymerase II transcription subunit 9 n=1 Tax=Coprinellus micaceus TaxID=71717 RepID=A0A4Y7SXN1_COPMI|nr:hypothetical protein FA13DRAFT_1290809 [Coprinellus micaceus]TEB26374.1 hypothetical protein FA13DRAFT_1756400 [Coprinellus micaceus]